MSNKSPILWPEFGIPQGVVVSRTRENKTEKVKTSRDIKLVTIGETVDVTVEVTADGMIITSVPINPEIQKAILQRLQIKQDVKAELVKSK
jgi:hypothetical protein